MTYSTFACLQYWRVAALVSAAVLLLFFPVAKIAAQSTEVELPTPVLANNVEGIIAARDVGDARLTRHFYTLTGTPGDLVFTVESKNLNGDIDLFTAGSLRPLAKVTMYAGEAASTVSKSIYLRRRETLILRIEARSANDDPGSYRIRFEGSFEPISGEVATTTQESVSTTSVQTEARADKNTRRVSSVGARIEEERTETSAATDTATATTTTAAPPPVTPPTVAETKTPPPPPVKRARVRRPNTRVARTKPATNKRTPTVTLAPPLTPPAEAGAKLIIETRDGMRVERYMSVVRRVTVENGQIVVILKDGKVERQPLSAILRMAIEP